MILNRLKKHTDDFLRKGWTHHIYKMLVVLIISVAVSCGKGDTPVPPAPQPPVIPPPATETEFKNPLLSSGPDPWVVQKDTNYYYTHTAGNKLILYKTNKMSSLGKASQKTIWSPPSSTAYSENLWAPELHSIGNKWYMYFAADDGNNQNHRIYVVENQAEDPMNGTWTFKGKVADATNKWAIDATLLEYKSELFMLWSGWQGDTDIQQDIFIAKMSDPITISSERVKISSPTYNWEKAGSPPFVNEGPQVLKNASGEVFLTFSASGCWTDAYSLGLLRLQKDGDPMNPDHWTKTPTPVFSTLASSNAYAPGHNGFFKSRDGSEDWMIYHANSAPNQGCGDKRSPRMQKFTWNADGSPNFGEPVKINAGIKKPAGE